MYKKIILVLLLVLILRYIVFPFFSMIILWDDKIFWIGVFILIIIFSVSIYFFLHIPAKKVCAITFFGFLFFILSSSAVNFIKIKCELVESGNSSYRCSLSPKDSNTNIIVESITAKIFQLKCFFQSGDSKLLVSHFGGPYESVCLFLLGDDGKICSNSDQCLGECVAYSKQKKDSMANLFSDKKEDFEGMCSKYVYYDACENWPILTDGKLPSERAMLMCD